MRHHAMSLLGLGILFLFSSCGSYKQVPYLQGSENFSLKDSASVIKLFDARIMPKDLLTITVNSSEPEAVADFNLTVQSVVNLNSRNVTSQPALQSYLVDNDGCIDFPIFGKIKLGGLTKSEAENKIRSLLMEEHLKEAPIVSVRMINYKISVLGEVVRPNTFTIANEKINILEALALAGDMTIYGRRDNLKLIRETITGEPEIIELNLNAPEIVLSPYYYLQQNDILYVTPNKVKAKTSEISSSTTIWISITTALVSIASLIVTIFR